MLNKVMLIGNLGRDPETRATATGAPVANFSLATSRRWNDRDGNRQEATEWHNVVVWGKQAEIAARYLTKGKQIYLEGRLQTSKWEKDGETRYRTEIICESFQMLGRKTDGGEPTGRESQGSINDGFDEGAEDDIPF